MLLECDYSAAAPLRRPSASTAHRSPPVAGNGFLPFGLPRMDRFFLAMMVSAVLLLVVAADLLVNGPGLQEPMAVANALPASSGLLR